MSESHKGMPNSTRSRFLKAAAGLVTSFISSRDTKISSSPEKKNAQNSPVLLQTVFEDTAHFTPRELEKYKQDFPDILTEWDSGREQLLNNTLKKLPTELIAPKEKDKKVRIVLTPPVGVSSTSYFEPKDTIYLSYAAFQPKAPKEALMSVAGALTERKVLGSKLDEFFKFDELVGGNFSETMDSVRKKLDPELPFIKKLEKAVERTSHAELAERINPDISPKAQRDLFVSRHIASFKSAKKPLAELPLAAEEYEKALFYMPFIEAVNHNDPQKFYGMIGGVYSQGPAFFHKWMGKYFPEDVTQKMYNYLKDSVFKKEF